MDREVMRAQEFTFLDGLRVVYLDDNETGNVLSVFQGNTRLASVYVFKKKSSDPRIARIHELVDELKRMFNDE